MIHEQELHSNTEDCSVSSPDQSPTEASNALRLLCQMVIDINDWFPLICFRQNWIVARARTSPPF